MEEQINYNPVLLDTFQKERGRKTQHRIAITEVKKAAILSLNGTFPKIKRRGSQRDLGLLADFGVFSAILQKLGERSQRPRERPPCFGRTLCLGAYLEFYKPHRSANKRWRHSCDARHVGERRGVLKLSCERGKGGFSTERFE